MQQLMIRAFGCVKQPVVGLMWLLLAGGGAALVMVPLLGLPGYELSAVLAISHGMLAAVFGIAAARQERRLIQGFGQRPTGALRHDSSLGSALSAFGAGVLLAALALVPPLIAAVTYALLSTRCDPFVHVTFYPLLAVPSAVLAVASGVLAGFRANGWFGALCWHALLLLVSIAATVWPLVMGPQAFAFNHFLGYLPGPLYDEALAVTPAVYWFRLETALWALLLCLITANGLDMKSGQLSRPHVRLGSGFWLAAVLFALFTLEERAPSLGTRMSDAALAERLGGLREGEHVVLHYPRGTAKEDVERMLRDAEFRHAQVSAFLGEPPPGKVTVWWYRSAAEKQRLVGAEHTQFAKPWRREVHINGPTYPHPVLKHELVHAMAAPYGAPPFGVAAKGFGFLPNAGVIEGLAVAGDDPHDSLTLHEWAAGMQQQKLLPDVRELMATTGFYGASPSRAYAAAGSFLRWLQETHGGVRLRALYRDGDFANAYGQPLSELAAAWESFLRTVPLEPKATNEAFARFRKKALFTRACAREVATLAKEAAELLGSDPELSAARYGRCVELQPDEPGYAIAQAGSLQRAGRRDEARTLLTELASKVESEPSTAAEVAMARADLSWAMEKPDVARAQLTKVLELQPSPAMERTARVKLAALDASPQMSQAIMAYFRPGQDEVKLLVLREALAQSPAVPEAAYLIGRKLSQGDQPGLARRYLDQALSGSLDPSLKKEALLLKLDALFRSGDCPALVALKPTTTGFGSVFDAVAQEWVDRCDFETRAFGGVVARDELVK